MMNGPVNVDTVKKVAKGLKPLLENLVFVGGAIMELYADAPGATPLRPTTDVDIVIELVGYGNYARLEEELSKLGFYHDPESEVVCRYKFEGITVDIMPMDEEILGFSNRWYESGMGNIQEHKLGEDTRIKLFEPPYFLASKFEAFKGRGVDRRTSHDFEDIVYFLDNRENWIEEILGSDKEVRGYLRNEFKNLLEDRFHKEEIAAHLPAPNRKARGDRMLEGFRKIAEK